MRKAKIPGGQSGLAAFQHALDAADVIGKWEWDAATDRVRADGFAALVYNVDTARAKEGLPFRVFAGAIHASDRERVYAAIQNSARENSPYLIEHRVILADGQVRWVLARGRFGSDHLGRAAGGSGILVDITRMRMSEGEFDEVDSSPGAAPMERAADHAIAAQYAIAELRDPELKALADALLLALGCRLARKEVAGRRFRMN
ncbi:PAS domain-containing protein [Methylobacterium fujisawaense]|uniref:PAS domain-containing protein n=1 Tax=Methylobacterium fujisawaense TaxID=107400 RepID=UPI002F358ECC